mgnify:CR=1 FL=1
MSRSASRRTRIDAEAAIAAWIESGRIVDLILVLIVLEALWLAWWLRRRGGALALLPNLVAGACLLLALRAGLSGAGGAWLGVTLLSALAAHLADLAIRLRR